MIREALAHQDTVCAFCATTIRRGQPILLCTSQTIAVRGCGRAPCREQADAEYGDAPYLGETLRLATVGLTPLQVRTLARVLGAGPNEFLPTEAITEWLQGLVTVMLASFDAADPDDGVLVSLDAVRDEVHGRRGQP